MRDKRFIAEHRGGILRKEQHRQLILWACDCGEHILHLSAYHSDPRLRNALSAAKKWVQGVSSVGDARTAALEAFSLANESTDTVTEAVARAFGHAAATAHMADHSLGAAEYALKAVKYAGGSVNEEKAWQEAHLPEDIKDLIISARALRKGLVKS